MFSFYQHLIGVMRRMVELGCIDIVTKVSMLSSYLARPREGHLENALHVMGYLRLKHNSQLIFDPTYPDIDQTAQQAIIETSVFGAEFVAMKHGIKMLRGLRYKIRMMGIPLSGPTYIYGDNKSQVTNSSRLESTLKKKCNSICYHAIRELVAMGETLLMHIRTGENLADFFTKTTSGAKCRKLVSGVVHDIYNDFPKQ